MSWGLTGQITDSAVATKAAKDGSDFTNPSAWRTGLGVFSKDEIYGRPRQMCGGLAFAGDASVYQCAGSITGGSIGTGDFTARVSYLWPSVSASDSGHYYEAFALYATTAGSRNNSFHIYHQGGTNYRKLFISAVDSGGSFFSFVITTSGEYEGKVIDLVVARVGSVFTVYINGNLYGSDTNANYAQSMSAGVWCIGRTFTGTLAFNSTIYSAQLFTRALSASEVVDLSNKGVAEPDKWANFTGQTSGTLTIGKRYRITTYVAGDSFTNVGAASNATGVEFVATGTTPTTWTNSSTLTKIGCLLDPDLAVGVGYQAPDRSSNNYHGDISTTGVSHAFERYDSHHTIVKTLAHSDISSTAATTVLTTLPPNCGIVEIEFDRGTAFDAGITVDVGISGTQAKFVSAQSLASTGKVWVDSLSKVSESASSNTTIYIKKSGSTTVGSTIVRVTYRIRNK